MIEKVTRIKSGITMSVGVSIKIKKDIMCGKDYIWNPATCSCKNGKCLAGIISNSSVITCAKIIETTRTVPIKIVPIKITSENYYILLAVLLIIKPILIAASICCYLIKYQAK